jgi:hypothetical protein
MAREEHEQTELLNQLLDEDNLKELTKSVTGQWQ